MLIVLPPIYVDYIPKTSSQIASIAIHCKCSNGLLVYEIYLLVKSNEQYCLVKEALRTKLKCIIEK